MNNQLNINIEALNSENAEKALGEVLRLLHSVAIKHDLPYATQCYLGWSKPAERGYCTYQTQQGYKDDEFLTVPYTEEETT